MSVASPMALQGFPSASRLLTRAEFDAVQREGRRVSARFVTLVARPAAGASDRLGIIASRKIGNAVVRNRAKRRLRHLFRTRPTFETQGAARVFDLVAIPRREFSSAPFAAIELDFFSALAKLRGVRRS